MNIKEIRDLINLMKETKIEELEVEKAGTKVRIKRGQPAFPLSTVEVKSQSLSRQEIDYKSLTKELDDEKNRYFCVKSPIVGTFYRSPAPGAPPYIEVGDIIKKGQILCIIEAMKLMNEIESDVDGKIIEILPEKGQPVEYGEVLFYIEISQ